MEGNRCIDFPGMRIFIFIDSFMYSFCRIIVYWQGVMDKEKAIFVAVRNETLWYR